MYITCILPRFEQIGQSEVAINDFATAKDKRRFKLQVRQVILLSEAARQIPISIAYNRRISKAQAMAHPRKDLFPKSIQVAASERPTFQHIHFCSLIIPRRNQGHQPRHDNSIPCMGIQQIYGDAKQPRRKKRIKVPIFLEALLAVEIMQESQSNLEEKVNSSILKDDCTSSTDPSINSAIAIRLVKQNQLNFASIEIKKSLPAQSRVSCRSDSSSEANSSCCHRPNA